MQNPQQQQQQQAGVAIAGQAQAQQRGGNQSNLPRGGGRGQGRGRGVVNNAQLNPGASQFVPGPGGPGGPGGNKRPHDGDDDGLGRGKRARGGISGN